MFTLLRATMLMMIGMTIGLLLSLAFTSKPMSGPSPQPTIHSEHAPRIEGVRDLSTLLTTRLDLCDVEFAQLDGYSGDASAALLVRGQAELGIDLTLATLTDVDPVHHSAVLHLPTPAVVTVSVDQAKSTLVAIEYHGLWWLRPQPQTTAMLWQRAFIDAQVQMRHLASAEEQIQHAQVHAGDVIHAWSVPLEWRIEVRWE